VADGATGAWVGHDGEIAAFIDGVWVLIEAISGWIAFDLAAEAVLVRHDDAWVAVGSFLGAVTRFGVNTAADDTNRLAVKSNAVLFPTWFSGSSSDLAPLIGPGLWQPFEGITDEEPPVGQRASQRENDRAPAVEAPTLHHVSVQ
jgi:hypothetical protein